MAIAGTFATNPRTLIPAFTLFIYLINQNSLFLDLIFLWVLPMLLCTFTTSCSTSLLCVGRIQRVVLAVLILRLVFIIYGFRNWPTKLMINGVHGSLINRS